MKRLLFLFLPILVMNALGQDAKPQEIRRKQGFEALTAARSLMYEGEYKRAADACDEADHLLTGEEPWRRDIKVSVLRGEIYLAEGKSDFVYNQKAFDELAKGYRFNREVRHDLLMAIAAARIGKDKVAHIAIANPVTGPDHYLAWRGIDAGLLPGNKELKDVEARALILLAAHPESQPADAVEYGSRALVIYPAHRAATFLVGMAYADQKAFVKARAMLKEVSAGSDKMAVIAQRRLNDMK